MARKRPISERISWKGIAVFIAGSVAGMLILFAFGFMSPGTHLERQNAAIDEVVRPLLADICALEYARLPDYAESRATLVALTQKSGGYNEARSHVQGKLPALNKQYPFGWSITDKCAERILAAPAVKTALP